MTHEPLPGRWTRRDFPVFAARGLAFSDEGGEVLCDYLDLSAQVKTAFSSSDVGIETILTWKIGTGHTVAVFAFNTVIVALLAIYRTQLIRKRRPSATAR